MINIDFRPSQSLNNLFNVYVDGNPVQVSILSPQPTPFILAITPRFLEPI
jgi:hypothetical protein